MGQVLALVACSGFEPWIGELLGLFACIGYIVVLAASLGTTITIVRELLTGVVRISDDATQSILYPIESSYLA